MDFKGIEYGRDPSSDELGTVASEEVTDSTSTASTASASNSDRTLARPLGWGEWMNNSDSETDEAADDRHGDQNSESADDGDALETIHSTEVGTARAFAEHHRADLIYCLEQKEWYRRRGQTFSQMDQTTMQGVSMVFMEAIAKRIGPSKTSSALQKRSRIKVAPDLARSFLATSQEHLDADPYAIGTNDGSVLHLSTLRISDNFEGFITKRTGANFEAPARCPIWKQFLNRVLDGDQGKIEFLQRAVGYSLTGHTDEQCLFVLVGNGANGKTLILNTLSKLFGEYAATTPMQSLTVQRNEQTHDLAHLVGKRFVAASEGEAGQQLAESKIKRMTGGDLIACRHLYRSLFTYKPQFKLWLATNNLPLIKGVDEGIWRRIKVIRFPVTIPVDERDPKLAQKLEMELSGILNWALEGLTEWRKAGLQTPQSITDETEAYRFENDPIEQWIRDRCSRDAKAVETTANLFADYQSWAEEGGNQLARVMFGKTLAQKGFQHVKRNTGSAWRGLSLDWKAT